MLPNQASKEGTPARCNARQIKRSKVVEAPEQDGVTSGRGRLLPGELALKVGAPDALSVGDQV